MSLDVLLVCGFGRCGSSLMLQMLAAGGIPTTGIYPSFEDERTGLGKFDVDWLSQQGGRAVKVLDPHKAPRFSHVHRAAIWIDRDPREQAKSYAKFAHLVLGVPNDRSTRRALEASFKRERVAGMCAASPQSSRLFRTTFEMLVECPRAVLTVLAPWLESFRFSIDVERAAAAVLPRTRKYLPGMLEFEQIAGTASDGAA